MAFISRVISKPGRTQYTAPWGRRARFISFVKCQNIAWFFGLPDEFIEKGWGHIFSNYETPYLFNSCPFSWIKKPFEKWWWALSNGFRIFTSGYDLKLEWFPEPEILYINLLKSSWTFGTLLILITHFWRLKNRSKPSALCVRTVLLIVENGYDVRK